MGTDEIFGDFIQFLGSDPGPDVATHFGQRLRHENAILAKQLDLLVRFQINHNDLRGPVRFINQTPFRQALPNDVPEYGLSSSDRRSDASKGSFLSV